MSSQLSLFNAVPAGAIEVILDKENHPWFKRAHVGKFLEVAYIHTSLKGLDRVESRQRSVFGADCRSTTGWSGPKEEQNKTDIFLSVYGVMYVIVNSRKPKGKELREWILNEVIPRGFNKMIEEKDT